MAACIVRLGDPADPAFESLPVVETYQSVDQHTLVVIKMVTKLRKKEAVFFMKFGIEKVYGGRRRTRM